MEIGRINSVIMVFRRDNRCLCMVRMEYRYYKGLQLIPELTFSTFVQQTEFLYEQVLSDWIRGVGKLYKMFNSYV